MVTERVKHLITEALWFLATPDELKERREQIADDLRSLRRDNLIPQNPCSILDAGSGSGGGTMAIKKLFPRAKVWAIDDGSSLQNMSLYRRRPLPSFAANFQPISVESFADCNTACFDLILACRLPICYDRSPTWKETCLGGAKRLIALAKLLSPDGVLVFGYSPREYPTGTAVLQDNFLLSELFAHIAPRQGPNDHWLVLRMAKQESINRLTNNPLLLLSDEGQKLDYPYHPHGGIAPDIWDF